jgi:hypothetical protein
MSTKIGRPPGSLNRTSAEIKRDAELALAKAKVKILEEKKKKDDEKKAAKKAAEAAAAKKGKGK